MNRLGLLSAINGSVGLRLERVDVDRRRTLLAIRIDSIRQVQALLVQLPFLE